MLASLHKWIAHSFGGILLLSFAPVDLAHSSDAAELLSPSIVLGSGPAFPL